MNYSEGKAYFTEHAVVVQANNDNDTRFFYYLMLNLNLGRWVTQSAQPGLAVGIIVQIKTWFPSKEEQIRIASLLDWVDDTIASNQRKQLSQKIHLEEPP